MVHYSVYTEYLDLSYALVCSATKTAPWSMLKKNLNSSSKSSNSPCKISDNQFYTCNVF